jgi:hypothetical protein
MVVIEPGGIQTEWSGIAAGKLWKPPAAAHTPTRPTPWPLRSAPKPPARRSSSPMLIADAIAKAITARRPKTRYAVGYGAWPIIVMHDVLPDCGIDALMRRVTGVPS